MAPPASKKKKKKNRGPGTNSKKQPGSSDDPASPEAASASRPPSSPSPPSQHDQPPPSPPIAAPDHHDASSSSPPPGVVSGGVRSYLSEAEKDIIRLVLTAGNGEDAYDGTTTKRLEGPVMLEEMDGRALLRHFLDLLEYSLPKTTIYIETLKDLLEKKKTTIYTRELYMDLFAAALEDVEDNFDKYGRMTKLLLKKAKHDRDRSEEGGESSSSGVGGASGEPFNS